MANVTITWTTDIPATSWVEYGITTGYGSDSGPIDPTLLTSHSVTLTGLTAGTLYDYRVHSRNDGGSNSVSSNATFTAGAGAGVSSTMIIVTMC